MHLLIKFERYIFIFIVEKQLFNQLPELLTSKAQEELELCGSGVSECSIIYLPMIGYLLTVPENSVMLREDLEFFFTCNESSHYKSDITRHAKSFRHSELLRNKLFRELDARVGDLKFDIIDRESLIMLRLQSVIMQHAAHVLESTAAAAKLDWYLCHSWSRGLQ